MIRPFVALNIDKGSGQVCCAGSRCCENRGIEVPALLLSSPALSLEIVLDVLLRCQQREMG